MKIWKIILNAGTILGVIKSIESVIEACIKEKRPPKAADFKVIIDGAEKLFDSGVIDFPDFDEKQVVQALESIKAQL